MESRKVLIYLAVKYEGDWEKIYSALTNNEEITEQEAEKVVNNLKCKAITILDEKYPYYLKFIQRPPFVLFYHGDISLLDCKFNSIAVVGSRDCNEYGIEVCQKIVKDLAKELIIISGMARGIDSLAHECAIAAHGKTIAVLGSGINYPYPYESRELYKILKKDYLVISEYPDKTMPFPGHFPVRNRIVAGLTNNVFVPQASKLSGTSITVTLAATDGANVFCAPDRITADSLGNYLIKNGAILVENAEDIFYEMGYQKHTPIFK